MVVGIESVWEGRGGGGQMWIGPQLPSPPKQNNPTEKVVGRDAEGVRDNLAAKGIMVRHYAKAALSGYVRISVGLPAHTDALVAALRELA